MKDLDGKIAIVTGGAKGIGRAIVLGLAERGSDVAVADMDLEGAKKTAKDAEAFGVRSLAIQANIVKPDEVASMIASTQDNLGAVDILVNNAGITRDNLMMRMSEEEWESVIQVNLTGTFHCTKGILRAMMRQRSGKIINITSVVGVMGNAGQANYAASKAGLIGFTKSVAKEVASRNIQVNAVAPGFIETEMTDVLPEDVKAKYMENIPAGRGGTTEEVTDLVAFLASSASNYITGQVIHVDGGLVM